MKAHLQVLPYTPGEDTQDALNCRSVSANEPLIIGLFCGKCPTKIKHPFLCILTTLYHIYNVQIWLEGYGVTSKKKNEVGGVHGGEDVQDGFSCRSLFAKEPLIIGPVCGRRPIKIWHPMGLCNRVVWYLISRVGIEK